MRKKGIARRRSSLNRVAHEVLVVIEERRKVRREIGDSQFVRARGGLDRDAHSAASTTIAASALASSRLAVALNTAAASTTATSASGSPRCSGGAITISGGTCSCATTAVSTASTAVRASSTASLPIQHLDAFAVEKHFKLFAVNGAEAGRRHVVAKDRRDRHAVFALRREDVIEKNATTRSEGQAFDVVVLRTVFGSAINIEARSRRLSHRQAADLLTGVYIRFDERGRHRQCSRHVIETA